MAQGEGGTAVSGEAGHIGKEEHRGVAAEGAPDLLCMHIQRACTSTNTNTVLTAAGTK